MARKPARRSAYRSTGARRSYSARSRPRARTRSRVSGGSRGRSQQTVRLVIETAAPSAVARPEGVPQVEVATKKAKF